MDYTTYFEAASKAQEAMLTLTSKTVDHVLLDLAKTVREHSDFLLAENKKDLLRMDEKDPKYDRLKLTVGRIESIASDMINIAHLTSPIDTVMEEKQLDNGLSLKKVRVPLGVVSVIYEARPNVTLDVFALCFKTKNVAVLKGGSDAFFSNQAIMQVVNQVLDKHHISRNIVVLLPVERAATEALLNAVGYVDVLIPRGSQQLIHFIRANSRVPVIETGAGIVHTYFDQSGDVKKASLIIDNAKTRKVSACNALDCLLVHEERIRDLPQLTAGIAQKKVEVYADPQAYDQLAAIYPTGLLHHADVEHFGTEFLSMKMAIKTVSSFEEAVEHIRRYGSRHSEAIIAEEADTIAAFMNKIDASAVYANASPAFTDGAQFGLGAEIGISTQKLHARGPMGLVELTSYKWLISGNGQIRLS